MKKRSTIEKDIAKASAPFKGDRANMSANNYIGFPSTSATGGSFPILQQPTIDTISSGVITADFNDPTRDAAIKQAQQDAYAAEMKSRYDLAMSKSIQELNSMGYWLMSDGSLFTGADPNNAMSWLDLQTIQSIENGLGTPGALLLHLQAPALAKDTAGYSSGSSGTFQQDGGVTNPTPPTQPIPEVDALPPVTKTDNGTTVFVDTGTPTPPSSSTGSTIPSAPPSTANQSMAAGIGFKSWWLWIIAAIIVSIIYVQYAKRK
jgi:hypothetical protein